MAHLVHSLPSAFSCWGYTQIQICTIVKRNILFFAMGASSRNIGKTLMDVVNSARAPPLRKKSEEVNAALDKCEREAIVNSAARMPTRAEIVATAEANARAEKTDLWDASLPSTVKVPVRM